MKGRLLFAFLILLFFMPSAFAQSTTVSGTITDTPDGQAWFGGTYSFVFRVSPSNPVGPYFWAGSPFSTSQTIAGQLDGSGHYSVSVPSNTSITPAGSTWDLTVCPLATAACLTVNSITITSGTQTVAPTPPSIRINLSSPPQNPRAYQDGELVSGALGQSYYNITNISLRYCSTFPCGWTQISGGSGASLPFSVIPFSSSPSFNGTPQGVAYGITLTGNVISSTITGTLGNGNVMKFHICQGAGGPWTFAFPANFLNTTAIQNTGCTDETYSFDGTNWSQLTQPAGGGSGGGGTSSGAQGTIQAAGVAGAFQSTNVVEANNSLNVNEDTTSKGPNPSVDCRFYGCRAVAFNTTPAIPGCTATINATSTSATLSSACGLINGDGIDIWGAGATNTLSTPAAPTVTPSIAQGSTGTGYVVNGPSGSTSYGYEIAAFDIGQGVTAASSATTLSTGSASLGAQSVNITSMSRSNNIVTVTTALPHGLPVGCLEVNGNCPLVEISSGNGLTDAVEFVGGFILASVPDNTHFTYQTGVDTRFGVLSATSTGGVATWFNANHLQLPTSNPAGVRAYAIYGRNCPATCNLIGISMPVNASITSDPSYMAWDDFGSPMMANASFPAWLPTTAPSSATNDTLITTIASGGTTTSIATANAANNSVSGATILIDATPSLIAAATATNSTGGAILIPVPTSSILNKYVVNSYANIGAVNSYAIVRQSGAVFLNDTIAWNSGQWSGNLQPSSGNGIPVRAGFCFEAHTPLTVGSAYPGIYITGGMAMRGITLNGTAQNLYNYIFSTSGGPQIYEDNCFAGASGSDLMGVPLYFFTSQGGGFGGDLRQNGFTTGTPSNATATPLFISKNNGEWNFHYLSCANRGFTFIGGTNGGVNVNWDMGEECQAGAMPVIAMMSRGVGGSVNWASGSLDTDANAAVANWAATPNIGFFVSGLGGAQTSNFSSLTGRQFVSVNPGSWLNSNASQLGQNFNVFYGTVNGFIYDGQTNSGTAQKINQNQIIGPNYSSYTDPSTPVAPTCTVITAGPPFPAAGNYHFIYNPVFQNGGQGIASPASNTCTVDGATQQITVTYALVPGVVSYVWTLDGTNFPNVNGINCLHTTSFPTSSWTYQGGTCGFQSPPTWSGGGYAGLTGGKVWANTFNVGQYADIAEISAPANPTASIDRLYADSTTHRLNCLSVTGANCLFPYVINSYSGNHTLSINEQAVVGTATLTFTAPHAAAGRSWDVFCISPSVCTLGIDSGTLYGNGATGPFTVAANAGTRVSCDGTNCYAGSSGGGGGSPGGSPNALQSNGGGSSFQGTNPPSAPGNYLCGYFQPTSSSVAPSCPLPGVPINQQTGTSYTIGSANYWNDRATVIRAINSGAQTYTAVNPSTAGFGFNMPYTIWNFGTGSITETTSGFHMNGVLGGSLIIPPNWVAHHFSDGVDLYATRYPSYEAFPSSCTTAVTVVAGVFGCGSAGSVSSISGDGSLINNVSSTGAVTLTLGNAGANTLWGRCTGTTGTPSYCQITDAMLTAVSHAALFNASNVWTGLQDFSGATMKIPSGAGFTASATSMIGYDTTNKNVHLFENAADSLNCAFSSAPANNNIVVTLVSSGNVLCSGVTSLPSGTTATTQAVDDNSTNVATTAYVDRMNMRSLGWGFGDLATGSALTTSEIGYITVPYACTIVGWHIMADAGTVTIKTARINGGTALPTIGSNSISTSGVSLSTGTKVDSTTVTDFTSTAIASNDTLGFFITAVATAKQITFQIDCKQ